MARVNDKIRRAAPKPRSSLARPPLQRERPLVTGEGGRFGAKARKPRLEQRLADANERPSALRREQPRRNPPPAIGRRRRRVHENKASGEESGQPRANLASQALILRQVEAREGDAPAVVERDVEILGQGDRRRRHGRLNGAGFAGGLAGHGPLLGESQKRGGDKKRFQLARHKRSLKAARARGKTIARETPNFGRTLVHATSGVNARYSGQTGP